MLQEINLFGLCVSPVVVHLALAAPPFLACRWLLARTRLLSRLWHPALFELCLFIIVVTGISQL